MTRVARATGARGASLLAPLGVRSVMRKSWSKRTCLWSKDTVYPSRSWNLSSCDHICSRFAPLCCRPCRIERDTATNRGTAATRSDVATQSSSRSNFGPAPHTTLTSAVSPPRRHHNDPDIAMLPALRRVAPRITKTAVNVNARALSKGTMDMRPKGPISNPKLGIIRLDYDYEAVPGDIDHPKSFPCGTAWSKAASHMATAKPIQRTAHEAPGSLHTLAERLSRSATGSAWRFRQPVRNQQGIGDFGLRCALLAPSRRGGLPRRAGPLVRDGPGGH